MTLYLQRILKYDNKNIRKNRYIRCDQNKICSSKGTTKKVKTQPTGWGKYSQITYLIKYCISNI